MNAAKRMKMLVGHYLAARQEGPASGYDIRLVEPDNYEHYYILINPISGVYKGQKYIMEMKTKYGHGPDVTCYPFNAPYLHFITNIFHVNISANGGSICLDILKDKEKWSPLNSFDTIVQNILLLFQEPNNASPYNGDASKSWVECAKRYQAAMQKDSSVEEQDSLYLECFAPFIQEAKTVMKTNKLKQYGKWFPSLDPKHEDYDMRLAEYNEELKSLEDAFAKMKKKKIHVVSNADIADADIADADKDEPATNESVETNTKSKEAQSKEAQSKEAQSKEAKKPPRWAKYQKK